MARPWDGSRNGAVPQRWRLAPEDALLLYTDGVLDAKWNERERLGEARLAELLGRTAPTGAAEWVERLWNALEGCLALPDDVTIVAIGREQSRTRHLPLIDRREK